MATAKSAVFIMVVVLQVSLLALVVVYKTTLSNFLHVERTPNSGTKFDRHFGHTKERNKTTVAVGLALTTKGNKIKRTQLSKLPFFRSLLRTFCKTCSKGFDYGFFVAYDFGDKLLSLPRFRRAFESTFGRVTSIQCPDESGYTLTFVVCNYTGKPAWAQNDAMMEAYLSGAEFMYRVNDDTVMATSGWTETFIWTLDRMVPPRTGVVGPRHKGGNIRILTYDFTHRSHVDMFGFYYPRIYTDWSADTWITDVYKPNWMTKVSTVRLTHTLENGQRYVNHKNPDPDHFELEKDKLWRDKVLAGRAMISRDPRRIISTSLTSNSPEELWGAVRNAQLAPVLFPNWTLRFYVSDDIPVRILNRLVALDAQVVTVIQTKVPPRLWATLVAGDPYVDMFLLRQPSVLLTEEDAHQVQDWVTGATRDDVSSRPVSDQLCLQLYASEDICSLGDRPRPVKSAALRPPSLRHILNRE